MESVSNEISAIQERVRVLPTGVALALEVEEALLDECEEDEEWDEEGEADPLVKDGLGVMVADGKIVLLGTELETESNSVIEPTV